MEKEQITRYNRIRRGTQAAYNELKVFVENSLDSVLTLDEIIERYKDILQPYLDKEYLVQVTGSILHHGESQEQLESDCSLHLTVRVDGLLNSFHFYTGALSETSKWHLKAMKSIVSNYEQLFREKNTPPTLELLQEKLQTTLYYNKKLHLELSYAPFTFTCEGKEYNTNCIVLTVLGSLSIDQTGEYLDLSKHYTWYYKKSKNYAKLSLLTYRDYKIDNIG